MNRPIDDNFFSRWSRLKRAPPKPAVVAPEAPAAEKLPEGDALQELIDALPKLEDIVAGQDLSVFMKAWVPEPLRNAALRRLWSVDPAVRDFVSEALDYAYDYNNPASISGFGLHIATPDMAREALDLFDKALAGLEPDAGRDDSTQASVAPDERDSPTEKLALSVAFSAPSDGAVHNPSICGQAGKSPQAWKNAPDDQSTTELGPATSLVASQHDSGLPLPIVVSERRRHGGAMPR